MSQREVPTIQDLEKVIKYSRGLREFLQTFRAVPEEVKHSMITDLARREDRICHVLAFLVAGDPLPAKGCPTAEDYVWVEEHARDMRDAGVFPEGCMQRFKAARTILEVTT